MPLSSLPFENERHQDVPLKPFDPRQYKRVNFGHGSRLSGTPEAAVEVVEADPQLAEYEVWEEAALATTVDAYVTDERQGQEAERRECEEARRLRETWREAERQCQEAEWRQRAEEERLALEEAERLEFLETRRRREVLSQCR